MGIYANTSNIIDGQRIDASDVIVPIEALDAQVVLHNTTIGTHTTDIGTHTTDISTINTLIADLRSGAQAFAAPDINGGAIDNAIIGATVKAAGGFTTITTTGVATLNSLTTASATITGGSVNNTPIGGSTRSTGAFTTVIATTTIEATTTLTAGGGNVVVGNGDDTLTVLRQGNLYNTLNGYGDSIRVVLAFKRARNTIASPSMPSNNDYLGEIEVNGWDSDGFMRWVGGIMFKATENWTSTAKGMAIEFQTSANGTETKSTKMTLSGDGKLTLSTSPTWTAATTSVNRAAITSGSSTANVRDALGTLINDLKAMGLLL